MSAIRPHVSKSFPRRSLLKSSAAIATVAAAKTAFPFRANVAYAAGVETTKATFGFIALTVQRP